MKSFLNDKIKFLIIFIIILIVIIIAVLLIFSNKKQAENEKVITPSYNIEPKTNPSDLGTNEYYTIKGCIDRYYDLISQVNDEYNQKVIYNILNKDYIDYYSIKENNIKQLYEDNKYTKFIIEEIYLKNNKDSVYTYLIYGKQINENTEKSEDYGLILILDGNNKTFSVAPYNYITKLKIKKSITGEELNKIIDTGKIEHSKENENSYLMAKIEELELVKNIFKEYKLAAKYDAHYAYDLLDEEYREKRFKDSENAENYLKDNINNIFGYKLEKMSVDNSDPYYTRYVCLDNNGNYFIIKKDDQLMKYSIILDIYTIPVKEVTEKYNKANNAQKTAINIEKFKQMINLKDYNSAFNALDETFRKNNFGSVENFEKYIKQNWPEYINVKCSDYKDVSDVGTINVKISERGISEEELNKVIEKTFIVKLVDENNFVMSFNVEE